MNRNFLTFGNYGVNLLLRSQYFVNQIHNSETTNALIESILLNDEQMFLDLINSWVNLNERDLLGFTPLRHAIQLGRSSMAVLLLKHGANPNIPSNTHVMPLYAAISLGRCELVYTLKKYGAKSQEYFCGYVAA